MHDLNDWLRNTPGSSAPRHPQHQQLAEAHDKAQADRFRNLGKTSYDVSIPVEHRKYVGLESVDITFKEVELKCWGRFTPNVDYCDDGGFDIQVIDHCGDAITLLISMADFNTLCDLCFFEYERQAKEAAEWKA